MPDRSRLQAIEALAQQLYEESDPNATPWARRERTVRESWLAQARRILDGTDAS